ncbi:MAG: hypothetical protein SFV23_01505 [Planctomycetaceae bacterium]|nr:hypothetical protein [Planctomycetaceae bacterium]
MRLVVLFGIAMALTSSASAQPVAVQQPVIGTFSTATTVSVPDRGSIVLGGVGTAASGRTASGPFRTGSSFGQERQSSSASASAYIHDLRAMDEALLAEGGSNDDAELAEYTARLSTRYGRPSQPASSSPGTLAAPRDPAAEARRFEGLARAAEAKGRSSVARLHWQMAAKHGSKLAHKALADTGTASLPARAQGSGRR